MLILIIGIGLACFMSIQNIKPLKKVISILEENIEKEEHHDAALFDYIETSIQSLIDVNKKFVSCLLYTYRCV